MRQKSDLYKAILSENFSTHCKVNTQIIPNSSICLLDKSEKVVYTVGKCGGKWGKREQKGQILAFIPKNSQYSTAFHHEGTKFTKKIFVFFVTLVFKHLTSQAE